jgi:biotin-dependent carboxylase-like uncharacterized protein
MVKVLKTGLYSSIQDLGRFGYRDIGVPLSGAMDLYSAELANSLLGNETKAAILEMTMTGPRLKFYAASQIVITGANMSPSINDNAIENNRIYTINTNDTLSFGKLRSGYRAYLAVKGGFNTDLVMGSRSYFESVTLSNRIQKGDILKFDIFSVPKQALSSNSKVKIQLNDSTIISVFKGPEFELLTNSQHEELFNSNYIVSALNNRMAYQIEPKLNHKLSSILTSLVMPGTVQLTPSGLLIILMRDCQTTGGYPRVLQLSREAINNLSQKKAKDTFSFILEDF